MRRLSRELEPCTVTVEHVVEFLEQCGRPQSAALVRHISNEAQYASERQREATEDYNALLSRLHKYEPPRKYEPVSYQPPPEASD